MSNQPIPQKFYSLNPSIVTARMTTKELKAALLECPFISKGQLWDLKGRNLGAGVYEVKAVPWKEADNGNG